MILKLQDVAATLAAISDPEEVYRQLILMLMDYGNDRRITAGSERYRQMKHAHDNGFFWLPCVLCGNWQGGHEWEWGAIQLSESHGHGVCADCNAEAERLNELYPNGLENPAK